MQFLTSQQGTAWMTGRGMQVGENGRPGHVPNDLAQVRFLLPQTVGQLTWMCRFLSECLKPRDGLLLWVTEWGVWPSSENWHLYYRLRQSYGDSRLLHEAPAHHLLDFEEPELVSFLQVSVLSGWDVHLIPEKHCGDARGFVSHDEWAVLGHRDPDVVQVWRTELERAEYRLVSPGAA